MRLAEHSLTISQTTFTPKASEEMPCCSFHVFSKNRTHNITFFVRTSVGVLEWTPVKLSLPNMQMCIKALARVQNQFLLLDLVLRVWAPLLFFLVLFLFCSMQAVIKSLHRQNPKFSEIFQKTKGSSHLERKLGGHKLSVHFCCKLFLHIFKVHSTETPTHLLTSIPHPWQQRQSLY